MIPKDSDSYSDGDFNDSGELGWSEFDWEKYLRQQDDVVHRYLGFYEQLTDSDNRVDDAAQMMGWDGQTESEEQEENMESQSPESVDMEPYTLQRNPVFIATTAIYLSLTRSWERLAWEQRSLPQSVALAFQASLYRGERNAVLAIQSLDLGDYTMAVSLLKRSMRELNDTLNYLNAAIVDGSKPFGEFRDAALSRIFDLREIWLRVIMECRDEVARQGHKKSDDDSAV
ncbi:MAG: hypothetical protein WC378_08855 [Opitutaceae bacterium]|jgi:hypothetical protein